MKKVTSKELEFDFPYDGETTVKIDKKGTIVSDAVGEAIAKRYSFVTVEEVVEVSKEKEEKPKPKTIKPKTIKEE